MTRRWNLIIWVGFLIVLAAPITYLTVFVDIPATRDVPWATLLIFAFGLGLMARGVARAWRRPQAYRGRIAGSILLALGVTCLAFFAYGLFVGARQVPASEGAPRVGQKAPDFSLPDQDGRLVTLAGLLAPGAEGAGSAAGPAAGGAEPVSGALLIFYRGYW